MGEKMVHREIKVGDLQKKDDDSVGAVAIAIGVMAVIVVILAIVTGISDAKDKDLKKA